MRKPEPLGTEYKDIVDGISGNMLWLETQEGKERMKVKEFQDMGSTAACTLRGVIATSDFDFLPDPNIEPQAEPQDKPRQRLFLGDSWFGSLKTVKSIMRNGHHGVFVIKTAHSRSPKKFLDKQMKDMPGGTWIVLETTTDEERLFCVGYKYNKKNVLIFMCSRGAGSTEPGVPYEARFPDKYGNVCTRHVARPQVISTYFKYSNCVDLHNQVRQHSLALEKKWITQDCYFRLYTTHIGMNLTDTWKIMRGKHKRGSPFPTITQFADMTAYDMNQYAKTFRVLQDEVPAINDSFSLDSNPSSLSQEEIKYVSSHTRVLLGKKQVRCVWCSRVNLVDRKTTMKCLECDKGFCRDNSGRACWSHHVAMGACPVAPERGRKRRLVREINCREQNL
jgi:hypothetical protein